MPQLVVRTIVALNVRDYFSTMSFFRGEKGECAQEWSEVQRHKASRSFATCKLKPKLPSFVDSRKNRRNMTTKRNSKLSRLPLANTANI